MVRKSNKKKTYLTPNEVAELLMVSPTTVRLWASEGKIKSSATPGGHRRFLRTDIISFSYARGLTLQLPDDQTTRILIVDDDEEITKYVTRLLDHVDAQVATRVANNGFHAGLLIQSFQPHVVVLDIMMPGMDGIEVCKTIKQNPESKAIRVVAMTGFYSDDNVKNTLAAGAETCLSKPFAKDAFFAAIGIRPARTSA